MPTLLIKATGMVIRRENNIQRKLNSQILGMANLLVNFPMMLTIPKANEAIQAKRTKDTGK